MGKKTSEQIREEFMRYVCFKVKPNDEKHTMIERQIDLAYGAFNRTLKYKNDEIAAKVKQEKNAEGKKADAFEHTLEKDRMEAKAYCKDYLENTVAHIVIGKGESFDIAEYDDQMMVWCLELIKRYKNKSEYYTLFLGQAQKWINVMIKNLFILGMIEKPYPFLHIPIDRIILHKISEQMEGELSRHGIMICGLSHSNPEQDAIQLRFGNSEFMPWSKIDTFENYMELQYCIREHTSSQSITPLEWESTAWIE